MGAAERRLLAVGAVVDQELVYIDRLMSQLLSCVERRLTRANALEALAVERRLNRILWGRREELRPWGVE